MTVRELKYVIMGDDKLSNTFSRVTNSQAKATRGLKEHSDKMNKLRNEYQNVTRAMPEFDGMLGSVTSKFRMMLNPITLAVGAIAGIGIAMNRASKESALFELEFRKLENINLDKTAGQIEDLRSRVFGVSMAKGFDPTKTSQGFFDIQSLTGKSGYGTDFIVSQQAEFARAAGADINKYIAGTGIAMRNFGFGPEQLQEYNKAAMGLVATAKITYDELAQVSAMYAGPASAANQTFASANKLMAIFTTKTKSAEEAATLTKSAFTDLFKQSTLDSFKKIGIDLYDVKGNAKQIDQIMMELNRKFSDKTSARTMDELRNKFQGSEGINALLSAAKDQSGQLYASLSQFDNGGDGLKKMLESAKNDVNITADIVQNRLKTATVAWGEAVLPIKTWWNAIKADAIGSMSMILKAGYWSSPRSARSLWKDQVKSASDLEEFYASEMGVVAGAKNMSPEEYKISQAYYRKLYLENAAIVSGKKGDFVEIQSAKNKMSALKDLSQALSDAYYAKPAPKVTSGNDGTLPADDEIKSKLNGISGGGTRNVTVTIQKLVETFNVNTTTLPESATVVKSEIEEMLVRGVAGSEQILSN